MTEALRHLEVSEATWNRWRSQYGGMKGTEARRLRELEVENARLKILLQKLAGTIRFPKAAQPCPEDRRQAVCGKIARRD